MDLFRVRLNCIDHYQAIPTRYDPQLRNDIRPSQISKGPKVPVVRVFGATETGQKVCAHIHGAFPYLYVEYEGSLKQEDVGAYIYRLHLSIDHALAVSYRRDQYGENARFVARITLVKGVPFYGFHVGYRFFLKIYMFNPIVMTRLADLLHQGVVMKRKFQPYEAHLQYLLQFMTDYNLYGCDYLDTSKINFRSPVPDRNGDFNSSHLWHSQSVSPEQITDDDGLPRVSHCSVEVDICVQDILNRKTVKERRVHQDFVERLNPIPGDIKLVTSMAGLWKDETKRRRRQMNPLSEGSPFPPEVLVTMSADPRQSQSMGWIHEDEYRETIRSLVAEEATALDGAELKFDTFAKSADLEHTVKTTIESIEDLYPSNLMPVLGLPSGMAAEALDPAASILVDEQKMIQVREEAEDDFFPGDSDEEALRQYDDFELLQNEQPHGSKKTAQTSSRLSTVKGFANQAMPSHDLVSGVCSSGLKTGRVPRIPICQQLLDIAEHEGIIGRTTQAKRMNGNARPTLKRKMSGMFIDDPLETVKRIKHESKLVESQHVSQTGMLKRPNSDERLELKGQPLLIKPVSSQGAKSSPSSSDPSNSNHLLNFPIVKDPNDPNTKLRLSQSQNLVSRHPQHGSAKKQVTFSGDVVIDKSTPTSLHQPLTPLSEESQESTKAGLQRLKTQEALGKIAHHARTLTFAALPPVPTNADVYLEERKIPNFLYQDAYYSKERDVPERLREYAGREFRLDSNTLPFLPAFDPTGTSASIRSGKRSELPDMSQIGRSLESKGRQCSLTCWEFAILPPTHNEVNNWWKEQAAQKTQITDQKPLLLSTPRRYLSQIDGPTPKNKHGFRYTQKKKSTSVQHEVQYMSTMSLELHVNTRGKYVPNPEEDEVQCVFWAIKSDEAALNSQDPSNAIQCGMVVMNAGGDLTRRVQKQTTAEIVEETSELDLMVRMVEIVRTHDPDVLTGYEVHGSSWGYLIERARLKYDYNLCDEFSRMRAESHGRFGKENDRWGFTTTSTIRVTGRHMINIWRAMRGELNLLQYTMENVAWHLLHRRIPHYAWRTLTSWYKSGKARDLGRLLRYYQIRTRMDLEILDANELIPRTSEQARLLGVDFFSVFSRGSQFKVESIMFRIAKPENLILISPNRKQVGGQNALECLPLVMEPQSAFYTSPLLVLDFQSLYPSVMIAYNLCYSTFLGRITNWRGMNKMGFSEYKRQEGLLNLLKDYINIAPNGMMYVRTEIRKSLLAKMLTEILETRVMVKSGMKRDKDDKTLQQLLNNRQLALKLLANVTYGYTSASFSGRMPCSEIADSIVQTGRETLERAIAYIHSTERWGAEVVYGDTDSLFVYLKGKTRDQAFDIGNEIAKAITDMNPRPIKLKFEKVYHPCVLLAKKRYVGYKFESKDQVKPDFDAKGIETVRRDGTPAEQKIEEKVLRMLFETADLSQIKAYFQSQCDKVMRGAVSVQDFTFAKEVRLGTYSDKGPPPAGALISTRKMLEDARAEPQYGERVPYVVITGAPGARLIDRCVAPEDLLANPHWQLDAEYYISKNLIPPLERIFNLVGANVRQWYDEMPKVQRIHQHNQHSKRKTTLESYMQSSHCLICSRRFTPDPANAATPLCVPCRANTPASLLALQTRMNKEERKYEEVLTLCRTCSGGGTVEEVKCDSKDCPVFWTRMKQGGKVRGERAAVDPVIRSLEKLDLEW